MESFFPPPPFFYSIPPYTRKGNSDQGVELPFLFFLFLLLIDFLFFFPVVQDSWRVEMGYNL